MTVEELIEISRPNLEKVHPRLRSITETIIGVLFNDYKLSFGVHMGLRSFAVQDALYAQGRNSLGVVNFKRTQAGLGAISEAENKKRVTKAPAGKSWHQFGLAVDLVEDGDPNRAGIQWSWESVESYLKIGEAVQGFSEISYGGFWKSFKDYPHIELTGDLTLSAANLLYNKGGVEMVWESVDEDLRLKRVT